MWFTHTASLLPHIGQKRTLMKDFDAVLEQKIETFVGELNALVRQAAVDAVKDALSRKGAKATAPKRTGKKEPLAPKEMTTPEKVGRRSPEQLARTVTKVRKHVQAKPGQIVEQIGTALGMPTKDLVLPLMKLLKSGELRKTGIKRNTKYFPTETTKELGAKK
jgi:hypothetical protein